MSRNSLIAVGTLGVAVLAVQSISRAQPTQQNQGAGRGQRTEIVTQLRAAHKLLVEADHDYSGHRARAAEEVHKAIHELTGPHQPKPSGSGGAPKGVTANKPSKVSERSDKEPQANSDAQLQQAQSILQSALGEVNARNPKAATNVQAAIAEITTALSLK
jgi:hypothetical protein